MPSRCRSSIIIERSNSATEPGGYLLTAHFLWRKAYLTEHPNLNRRTALGRHLAALVAAAAAGPAVPIMEAEGETPTAMLYRERQVQMAEGARLFDEYDRKGLRDGLQLVLNAGVD
jgi:hypothetical protein